MKSSFVVLALVSNSVFAAPLIGTCKGLYSDCIGPKLDSGTRITKRCELNEYRTSYYVYEYSDAGRKETGSSIVTEGSSSAVSDSISRTTYPRTTVVDALTQELMDNAGLTSDQAKEELKKLTCKNLTNEVL